VLNSLIILAAKLRLITTIFVHKETVNGFLRETNVIEYRLGLLKKIKYVKPGFFQSDCFFYRTDAFKMKSSIFPEYMSSARNFFLPYVKSESGDIKNVFVHVRLGDYRNFTVFGKSALLPSSYYREAMKKCLDNSNGTTFHFYFVSDDIDAVKKEFKDVDNAHFIFSEDYRLDFCLMVQCDGGILSASSFSWWGAFFMDDFDYVFAPKHWLGFSSNIDYHENPTPEFFKLLSI
jgi:hypothetical protein